MKNRYIKKTLGFKKEEWEVVENFIEQQYEGKTPPTHASLLKDLVLGRIEDLTELKKLLD